jgi:peptidoglycan/xylan/chitin deacetylase (PgdA/CDA1 family)
MYHSVQPDSARRGCLHMAGMVLSESHFRAHMEYVAAHYQTITLSDYARLREHDGLPANTCVLTFDDGFEDFFDNARPVLAELGLAAVVFVIGATVTNNANGRGSWLHELYALIDGSSVAACAEAFARAVPDVPPESVTTKTGLRRWARKRFAGFEPADREELLRSLASELGVDRHPARQFMSANELRQLVTEGFELGGHTMHHELLSSLGDDALRAEIAESKTVLDAVGAPAPFSFCYPFGGRGSWDERTADALREHQFSCAVSTVEGLNGHKTDRYGLRRIRITGDVPRSVLVFRMLGLRAPLWKLQGLLQTMRGR